jgi:hypothetical protein
MGAASSAVDFVGDVVGGAVDTVGDVVGGVADTVGDVVGGAADAVGSALGSIDDFVNDNIPGGWTLPLVLAAAYATGGAALAGEAAAAGEAGGLGAALEAAGGEAALEGAAAGAGGMDALLGGSGVTDEILAAANASADPIASLNSQMGWTLGEEAAAAGAGAGAAAAADAALPPVVDLSTVDPTGVVSGGSGLAGAALGGLAGAAVGGVIDGLTPDIPGAGSSVPTKTYTPDWSMKFAPHTEYKDAPTFDFQFSEVPTDYLTQTQMMPGDQQEIGVGPGPYGSQVVQALRGNSAGKASDNNGFTLFQTATK